MKSSVIEAAKVYVRDRFRRFPHFSFGDGTIMYNHTIVVHGLAAELAQSVQCNVLVTELCALFHDIGKTLELDPETLEREHEMLGWPLTQEFLRDFPVSHEDALSIKLFFGGHDSIERTIVKDADILAFYADSILQEAFVKWANQSNKVELIRKKWDKFTRIKLERAREIGTGDYQKSLKRWFPDNMSA